MDTFFYIPVWIIQDILVFLLTLYFVIYIIKNEKHPEIIFLEMFAFVFLNAALYENLASQYLHLYGYGRSLIMIGSVPLSVPIFEFLIVYSGLKIAKKMDIKKWVQPFLVGLIAMIADFSLDPVSVKQIFTTPFGTIGRWTWFISTNNVNIFSEPVYNFAGWVLICGYAALFLLLGRYWFKKSNENKIVGYVYPFLTMIAAFILLVTPVSQFLLWLGPIFQKGSFSEWVMLGFWFLFPLSIILFTWKRRMVERLDLKKDLPIILLLVGFPLVNIIFTLIGGYYSILYLEILFLLIPLIYITYLVKAKTQH